MPSIWLGNTFSPRTTIMSSVRPCTFSMRTNGLPQGQASSVRMVRSRVRRGAGEDGGAEVGDQHDLALRHPGAGRDHGAAQSLGTEVEAEAAGEEPVPIRVLHDVAGAHVAGAVDAFHALTPEVEVAAR